MPTMIITGGAGFIGSNFVRFVLERSDWHLVVFDKLTYAGNLESLADVDSHDRYRFVRGDIADREAVRNLFAEVRPDAVVNFAAESHVDRSIDGPDDFIRTNVIGAFELLEAARHFVATLDDEEVSSFRFLHVSTDEVYGSLGATGKFQEETPYAPNSPYSASKASADHLARAYFHTYDLPVLVTNCSNNYGPFQFPEKLIPLMILNALDGEPLPVYGDGSNVRDWLYVEDHCEGILEVLKKGRPGEKYNLGGDAERTNLEVVESLCQLLESLHPAASNPALRARQISSYRDLVTFVTDRPGHDQRYAIDSSKIQEELGWRPQHDFEAGMRATVRWYLDHGDWCRSVHDRRRLGLGDEAAEGTDAATEEARA